MYPHWEDVWPPKACAEKPRAVGGKEGFGEEPCWGVQRTTRRRGSRKSWLSRDTGGPGAVGGGAGGEQAD